MPVVVVAGWLAHGTAGLLQRSVAVSLSPAPPLPWLIQPVGVADPSTALGLVLLCAGGWPAGRVRGAHDQPRLLAARGRPGSGAAQAGLGGAADAWCGVVTQLSVPLAPPVCSMLNALRLTVLSWPVNSAAAAVQAGGCGVAGVGQRWHHGQHSGGGRERDSGEAWPRLLPRTGCPHPPVLPAHRCAAWGRLADAGTILQQPAPYALHGASGWAPRPAPCQPLPVPAPSATACRRCCTTRSPSSSSTWVRQSQLPVAPGRRRMCALQGRGQPRSVALLRPNPEAPLHPPMQACWHMWETTAR